MILNSADNHVPMRQDEGSGSFGSFVDQYAGRFNLNLDPAWTSRQAKMHILKKFLKGTIYDNLQPWWMEYNGNSYVPLIQRRPAINYNLPKIIVNKSTSMLFGSEHFPAVRCKENPEVSDFLQYITRESNVLYSMLAAARDGSIGSVCIVVKVLETKFYLDVIDTANLTPVFDPKKPNTLILLTEKKKCLGESLVQSGYEIPKKERKDFFYVVRTWDSQNETYFMPYKIQDDEKEDFKPQKDTERSTKHGWGFVPAVWIKNSPQCHKIDGECTFEAIIDICIEISYQMSQLGRVLRYNSDPTMVVKDNANLSGDQIFKGGGHYLPLSKDGDAYMLEITGAATTATLDYVGKLREFALEVVRGDRSNPDKMSMVHSGKALQMLQTALISLVDEMRLCYGQNGLLRIYKMILEMCKSEKYEIDMGGFTLNASSYDADLMLDWPDWFPATPQDELQQAQALTTLKTGGVISNETATQDIADEFGIVDVKKELKSIKDDANVHSDDKSIPNQGVVRPQSKPVARAKKVSSDRRSKG